MSGVKEYPEWLSASKLLRDFNIEVTVENLSPLRVGSGREASLGSPVDLAVMRISYGGVMIPYIPGSSIKGVFRSTAISIVRGRGIDVCNGLPRDNCLEKSGEGGISLMQIIDRTMRSEGSIRAMKIFADNACLLCKIFGSPHYASKVIFTDAYPTDKGRSPTTGLKTGVAINRRTGAAHPGALFTVEYVEPGAEFRFSILCRNLPNYALGIISTILLMLRDGMVRFGGFKTRGFGVMGVKNLRISVIDYGGEETLRGLDEEDQEVIIEGMSGGRAILEGENAWELLVKLSGVWETYARRRGG